ncbi:MAG: ATP-binding protein [Actinomycetota bacterium]|nr:ATP-binding protein [Actinomycetota bacterium]
MATEKLRLRIGNLGKAVLITGQAYQDPKDALNEFISNAADEYAEGAVRGGLIRVLLRRRGRYPVIAIEDYGRGLDAERLRGVARSLFESGKAGDPRTVGEKAIGILAFQQLAGRCDIVTRPDHGARTFALRLTRGSTTAQLDLNERRRARDRAGTTVYLGDLDPDVLRVLTQRKIVNYLRRRRGAALERGDYVIEVVERRQAELVTPEEPDGVRLDVPAQITPWGRIELFLFVSPQPDQHRRVAVVGRGGTTIIDDIAEIEEFDGPPWLSDQVSGYVTFEALQQTSGRRAVLRDRDVFPAFVTGVRAIEPAVVRTLERVTREVTEETADRLAEAVRKIFGRVLKELDDLDNPMRTPVGEEPGEGALATEPPGEASGPGGADEPEQEVGDLMPPAEQLAPDPTEQAPQAAPRGGRGRDLPNLVPDPSPDGLRSRFDDDAGIVYYNDHHPDYILVKDDESSLLDYLATLVAKEYVVYNNPRAPSEELAEEMVRMLVRVRRHLPRRR